MIFEKPIYFFNRNGTWSGDIAFRYRNKMPVCSTRRKKTFLKQQARGFGNLKEMMLALPELPENFQAYLSRQQMEERRDASQLPSGVRDGDPGRA